jgi:hypothetical protein
MLGIWRMLPARRQIQAARRIGDGALEARLTQVDEAP